MSRELVWLRKLDRWWSSAVLDTLLPWLTHLGSHIVVIAFLAGTWGVSGKMRLFQSVALLYCFISGIVYGLKYLVRRARPPLVVNRNEKVEKGPGEILDPSFPSAHTAYAFMMATLLRTGFPLIALSFSSAPDSWGGHGSTWIFTIRRMS